MLRNIRNFFDLLTGRTINIDDTRKLIRLGRDEYKYCDGDHALVLQIEMLTEKPNRLLYSSTIKRWLPPHENEAIDAPQRREIAGRIGRCLEKAGYTVEIDWQGIV